MADYLRFRACFYLEITAGSNHGVCSTLELQIAPSVNALVGAGKGADQLIAYHLNVLVVPSPPIHGITCLRIPPASNDRVSRIAADEGNPDRVIRQNLNLGFPFPGTGLIAN
jgi:hypothetical protein